MTGYIDDHRDPLSSLTIAACADIGYSVNYEAAEPYVLPSTQELEALSRRVLTLLLLKGVSGRLMSAPEEDV